MHSVLLLSGLAATCLGAALPPRRETIYPPGVSTVIVTVTVTATPPRVTFYPPRDAAPEPEPQYLGAPSRTLQLQPTPPWWWPTVTHLTEREAAPEPEPQVLGSPTRTVLQSPTPPWWWWPPHETADRSSTTFFPARNAAPEPEPEPQGLGQPSRTLQVSPTPPWWWGQWPAATPAAVLAREVDEKREPQGLGQPSRTLQVSPTPPWWWGQWPVATPAAVLDRDVEEKREPQGLGQPSRTVQVSPTPPWWWGQWPAATPAEIVNREVDEKREPQTLVLGGGSRTVIIGPRPTSKPFEIDSTVTLPIFTLIKKDPQSLVPPISRTNQITPTGPPHHHHTTSVSTVYITITVTDDPLFQTHYTATLPPLTLYKKEAQPQTLIYPPTRTNQITPVGYPTHPHHSSVIVSSTTSYGPSGIHHHHSPSPTRETITPSSVETRTPIWSYPTGTEIDTTVIGSTVTLPPVVIGSPPPLTIWGRKDKRERQRV